MKVWIDSHCHLADPRISDLNNWITESALKGLGYFVQGGVGPEDWQRQIQLAQQHKNKIGLCFGVHPYWVADHTLQECEVALDELANHTGQIVALGEMGLDFRPKILNCESQDIADSKSKQISVFEMQLELAQVVKKPIVLHLVQAHEDAIKILDFWGLPSSGGFVHSFNGSLAKAQEFIERGLLISVGGSLLRPDNERLRQAVKSISLEKLLIETDSPDQPGPKYQGQLNPLISLFDVAEEVAKIKGITLTEVLDKSRENLKRLLRLKENPDGTYNSNP